MGSAQKQDLAVLAPTMEDCRRKGWLHEAVFSLTSELAAEGVVYVFAPTGYRREIIRLFEKEGLEVEMHVIHLPTWESSACLTPLQRVPATYAIERVAPIRKWKALGLRLALQTLWGRQILAQLLPSVALVIRHPGARPAFDWLFKLGPLRSQPGPVVLQTSWRGRKGSTVLYRFSGNEKEPSLLAKVSPKILPAAGLVDLADTQITEGAGRRGFQIPQILWAGQVGGRNVSLQTVVHGQPAALVLGRSPGLFPQIIERITGWLVQWNLATRSLCALDRCRLDREILTPASLVAPLIEDGEAYQERLQRLCTQFVNTQTALVATHNDLTLWNILIDPQGSMSVIDWEEGKQHGFPLVDFFYAVTDAAASILGYQDRRPALAACFAQDGAYYPLVSRFFRQLCDALAIDQRIVEIYLHACLLHHAANELRSALPGEPHPFLDLVQEVAGKPGNFSKI